MASFSTRSILSIYLIHPHGVGSCEEERYFSDKLGFVAVISHTCRQSLRRPYARLWLSRIIRATSLTGP